MNIHEYQAKGLLAKFGVAVPRGRVAFTPVEAEVAAQELGGSVWVVKMILQCSLNQLRRMLGVRCVTTNDIKAEQLHSTQLSYFRGVILCQLNAVGKVVIASA